MRLFTKCKSCSSELMFIDYNETRVDFAKNRGKKSLLSCNKCYNKREYFVNEIYTKESKIIEILAYLILLIGTLVIGCFIYQSYLTSNSFKTIRASTFLLGVPISIFIILKRQDKLRVRSFNNTYF